MLSKAFLLALLGLAQVSAQGFLESFPPLLPGQESVLWSAQITPTNSADSQGVGRGNCAILTPDQNYLITTSIRGTVTAYNALDGKDEWTYNPTIGGGTLLRSSSCVVFPPNAVDPYMVYSVVENETSANPVTRVIALDMNGIELWGSAAIDGIAAGSPVTSEDGDYVFLIINSNLGTVGNFFVISAAGDGAVFYTQSDLTRRFSPLGIYHSPAEGHYMGGEENTNDMIVWSEAPKPLDTAVGTGAIFGFQFPVGFNATLENVTYIQLGTGRDFQANTAPVLTDEGRSLFWGVSRSGFRFWVGSDSTPRLDRYRFDESFRFSTQYEFNDNFRGEPVFATPALSSNALEPFVFGGTSNTQFVKQSWDVDATEEVIITTTSLVKTSAKIFEDIYVYYIESANGRVHQANFGDLTDRFTYDLDFEVEGEFALSENGSILYVASTTGNITALQLSEFPAPTASPSGTPTTSVTPTTVSPTVTPTGAPTMAPVVATDAPTGVPTMAPVAAAAATDAPTTTAPTMAPTVPDDGGGVATPAPTPRPTVAATSQPVTFSIDSVEPTRDSSAYQPMPMWTMALVAVVAFLFL